MNILLLGDSIRMGYQEYVKGKMIEACVEYPSDNGRYSTQFLYYIPHWREELHNKEYQIIHFNVGLWDIVRLQNERNRCFVSCSEYVGNVRRIVERLKFFWLNAKLIFATTTSVMEPCVVATDGGYCLD